MASVAPHAVYYRSSWHDFGIAHITDLHVARRIDYLRPRLELGGLPDAAQRMINFNDRFRGFIRYANYLHDRGVLDVIFATGDITDYQFEDDDDEAAGGNAWFMREILLGRSPGDRVPVVEELRVPIFVAPGNHDYRKWPYHIVFDLDIPIPFVDSQRIGNHDPYRLNDTEGAIVQGGAPGAPIPVISTDTAQREIEVDETLPGFKTHLANDLDYVVQLGSHRVVMLDSGPDTGIPDGLWDLWVADNHWGPDDTVSFVGGLAKLARRNRGWP